MQVDKVNFRKNQSLTNNPPIPSQREEISKKDLKTFNFSDKFTRGDVIDVYDTPREFFKALIKDINNAKERIYITNLIIANKDNDKISGILLKALIDAKKRGVDVKLILDKAATAYVSGNSTVEALKKAGIPVKLQPTLSLKRLIKDKSFIVAEHRKIFLVDDKAYLGGVCISDLWYNNNYRDLMLKLKGAVVEDIVKEISRSWPTEKFIVFKDTQNKGHISMEVIDTLNGDLTFKEKALELIRKAKKEIWVENQYLVDEDVAKALDEAAKRGVRVVLVVPKNKDDFINDYLYIPISKVLTEDLVKDGAEVWRYKGDGNQYLLHTKLMVVDDRYVLTGSHNLDYMSTERNHEISLLIDSQPLAERLKDFIREGIKHSEPETPLRGFKRVWAQVARFLIKHSPAGPVD